ncbi:MAG: hypothetical protein ACE37H_18190 [Phycisphaeraceae bacterium]
MPGPLRNLWLFFLAAACLLSASPVVAQQGGVEINIELDYLGLGGLVQRGVWTPVRMDLTNTSAQSVEVTCRWLLEDDDGDELVAERPNITLTPQRADGEFQSVWLYANPPMSTRPDQAWVFQAVDSKTGELLKQVQVQLPASAVVESSVNLVGVCGFSEMGLYPWRKRWSTQHEPLRVITGLSLETLPDRWYGLDSLSALVWSPQGGEPTSTKVSSRTKSALREWVYRGGHLVVVMPYAGEQWTSEKSGLSDLLEPIDRDAINRTQARPPLSVFKVLTKTDPVGQVWFDLEKDSSFTTLAEVPVTEGEGDAATTTDRPLIVGRRVGFGQVTLVGIDLSNKAVLESVGPFALHRVWTRIFSWRGSKTGELLPDSEFDDQQTSGQYQEAKNATHVELGTWLAARVARQRQTGPAVGLAFVLFMVYAVAAGLTFPHFLRGRGWERHSWLMFVGIVAVFSAIAWGGAWALRPASNSAAHFSVLDIDGNNQVARVRSWQSVLVPSFADTQFKVSSEADGLTRMDVVNVLSSPGHAIALESPGYPDQRTYGFDATAPHTIDIPMRSTTKSIVVDFLGQITAQRPGMSRPWQMPKAKDLRLASNGLPAGTITHDFPDTLTDVRIIYCPGGPQLAGKSDNRPMVYAYRDPKTNKSEWAPKTPLALPASDQSYTPLWVRPNLTSKQRNWTREGDLGSRIAQRGSMPGNNNASDIINDIALLSFYDALPPPVYETQPSTIPGVNFGSSPYYTYNRSLMRDLDLTHLITGRRVILIGHLQNGPSPVPLTVDGQDVEAEGWTVVRWIYDL